jgi:hypothetical protein
MPNVWSNDELNRACRCCRPTAGRSVADLVGFSAPPADYARVGWKIEGNGWTDTERHQKGQKRRIVAIARRWVYRSDALSVACSHPATGCLPVSEDGSRTIDVAPAP